MLRGLGSAVPLIYHVCMMSATRQCSGGTRMQQAMCSDRPLLLRIKDDKGWPEPYIYGVPAVFLAEKSPNLHSYTVYIYIYIRFWHPLKMMYACRWQSCTDAALAIIGKNKLKHRMALACASTRSGDCYQIA